MGALLRWLGGLPTGGLYAVASASAAVENVFPPLPSDVVVAFAAFASARGRGSVAAVFAAVLAGNVAGAMLMYAAGKRYGTSRALRRFAGAGTHEARLRAWYARYGVAAIAASRVLPGVRAVVPPVAGALGIGAVRAAVAIAIPSALWYAALVYLAFSVGGDFDALTTRIRSAERWLALAAALIIAAVAVAWWRGRRAGTSR